jgi:hypothetical protein
MCVHDGLGANPRAYKALSADTAGRVTFSSSLGANNLAAPASTYTNCAVSLGRGRPGRGRILSGRLPVLLCISAGVLINF